MSKPRERSSSISSTVKRNGKAVLSPAVPSQTPASHPANADRGTWQAYWIAQGQSWRTEPEIDVKRQQELEAHRSIVPDIEKGIYPFKGVKLSRADVEWLLATHENGRGPVDWSDESQQEREGLDVRGADLFQVDLHNLPLARLRGGLTTKEWRSATEEQRNEAAVRMERPNLSRAHLEGAYLGRAHLEKALLDEVILSDEKKVGPWLVDIRWGEVNLAVVRWSRVKMLADEDEARQKWRGGKVKSRDTQREELESAVRANCQLSVMLQAQGLDEEAARFAHRAQTLQRKVFWKQQAFGKWLFSMILALLRRW